MPAPADPRSADDPSVAPTARGHGGESVTAGGGGGFDDPRLMAAVQEYMAAVDAGQRPNRQEILARHPDIARELSACLQGMAFLNSAAGGMAAHDPHAGKAPGAGEADGLAGRELGDFELVREIGRGGMGVVYEAVQRSLNRRVALKVLPFAAALDPRHLQRFQNEAHAAAQLHHANIVPVYAVGQERSVHFFAMQLIEGQSLADLICELRGELERCGPAANTPGRSATTDVGPTVLPGATDSAASSAPHPKPPTTSSSPSAALRSLRDDLRHDRSRPPSGVGSSSAPPVDGASLSRMRSAKRSAYHRAVARLGAQAADALHYAHQQGVVHRDVKPANLLLDGRGTLWVTDFGLAQLHADSGLTQPGDVLGTYRYMSPEQASGKALVLDQRTDVYSLGLTLYELLTLERAVPGASREELMHQISSVDPRPPRAIDRSIPAELETILAKATSKSPAERYQTAGDMADDLRRFLADEPILARPPSAWDKSVKWTRRHKALTASAVVVLLVLTAAMTVTTVLTNAERVRAERSAAQAREVVGFFTQFAAEDMPLEPQFVPLRRQMLEAGLAYYRRFYEENQDNPAAAAALALATKRTDTALEELRGVEAAERARQEVRLLEYPGVRREIGIPDKAAADLIAASAAQDEKRAAAPIDVRTMTHEELRDMLEADAAERRARIDAALTPDQAERLRQLSRQARGVTAFADPDVVAALALNDGQREALRGIESRLWQRRPPSPPGGRPAPGRPGDGGPRRPRGQAAVEEMLAVLDASQRQTWQSLVGPPHDGPLPDPNRPQFRGGGGPGGPGGFDGPGRDGPRRFGPGPRHGERVPPPPPGRP